jgi:hypothetical protein
VYRAYRLDTLAMVQLAPFEQREDPFARIYPDPVVVRNEWQQLSTFGLIKSSRMLFGSGDVREFAHESLPGQTGCFEVLQNTAAGDVLASGWSVLPGQTKAPDAVILTYDRPGSASVARGFAVATRTIDRKDVARILPKVPVHCGWYVLLHTDQIPADAMVISAWAVDLQNARTYPLAGTHLVVR